MLPWRPSRSRSGRALSIINTLIIGLPDFYFTLISARFSRLPGGGVPVAVQTSTYIILIHAQGIIVQRGVLQVHREAQQSGDARHAVVGLTDDDGLARKEPIQLRREPGAALPLGAGLGPVALPAHDLGGVDEELALERDEQAPVRPHDGRQVGPPGVQDRRGAVPVCLVPGDVPHEGILPGGAHVGGECRVVGHEPAREDGLGTLHRVVGQGVLVVLELGVGRDPGVLLIRDADANAFQVFVGVPDSRVLELAEPCFPELDALWVDWRDWPVGCWEIGDQGMGAYGQKTEIHNKGGD